MLVGLLVAAEATSAHAAVDKNRPVTKIINLLKDMQAQLQKEQEEDEATYEKVACWCETNDKDKTAAIGDAEARITQLTTQIEEDTASSARLNTEIKNLDAEVAKNQEALDKATALRQKELAEFNAEEKDMLQSIGAMKSAITVLGKHHAEFAQLSSDTLVNVAVLIQHQFYKHKAIVDGLVTPAQKKAVAAFIQSPSEFLEESAAPGFGQSYAPQSGAIFGILKQMKETFETNLATSQKEEMQGQQAYEDLKAAKEEEIAAGQDQSATKSQERADTDERLAQAKQDLDDTRNTLDADQKFLMNLKETCANTDAEWEERQKARQEELKGCAEALAILSSDDAHDTFTRTFNFVQTRAEKDGARSKAEELLFAAAKKVGNPRLATLATRVRLDAFGKLVDDIDGMVKDLKKEKADDIKHKDYCVESLHKNDMAQDRKKKDIEKLDAKLADLTEQIEQLTKSIAALQAEVAEMQTQLKRAGEDREAENADFQAVVSDQRVTQTLLNNALNVLKAVYDKKALVQVSQEPAGPPPPPGFKKYEQSSGSGGVMGMIEQVIADTKQLEADAIKAETDAQKGYEAFVKDSNKSIEENNRDITNKSEEKATAEADKTAAEQDRTSALNEQQANENEAADLHKSCDFTLNNFEVKQAALEQEMEALGQAKSVLQGSGMFLFLQKRQ